MVIIIEKGPPVAKYGLMGWKGLKGPVRLMLPCNFGVYPLLTLPNTITFTEMFLHIRLARHFPLCFKKITLLIIPNFPFFVHYHDNSVTFLSVGFPGKMMWDKVPIIQQFPKFRYFQKSHQNHHRTMINHTMQEGQPTNNLGIDRHRKGLLGC